MEKVIFRIKGVYHKKDKCFPDLNDLLSQACRHPKAYGKYKGGYEYIVADAVRGQIRGYKATKKVRLDILWGEPINTPKPRDEDNVIAGGRKIIHDALTRMGVIADDDPKHIVCGYNKVIYTSDTPFIEVHIVEV